MKFGVREICDVVLRAKTAQKIGNKIFYKNEPVCYFDTLKTSTMEGAATTVYAQGGRGNARLMSWDGERTVTFTMEDALISPVGLSILTGAGLIEANYNSTTNTGKKVIQHITETIEKKGGKIYVSEKPYIPATGEIGNDTPTIYVMVLDDNNEVVSEPYLASCSENETADLGYEINILTDASNLPADYNKEELLPLDPVTEEPTVKSLANATHVLVDYYTARHSGAFEVNITPDKFGGTFYLEASTLWRDQATKKDLPAEFIIPACRVQSNFTFSMSSSGDPSTFTFTMDAFPDYTRWNRTEKVLATIQVLGATLEGAEDYTRDQTWSQRKFNEDGTVNNDTAINSIPRPKLASATYDESDQALTIAMDTSTPYVTEVLASSSEYKEAFEKMLINVSGGDFSFTIPTNDVDGCIIGIALEKTSGTGAIVYKAKVQGITSTGYRSKWSDEATVAVQA